ncbi:MAG TPA: hypothetical protein VF668_06665 [Pyrinomonadaceae bacterium]|jgi:predicted  nucleic acid-binding Zn-ribbon protein
MNSAASRAYAPRRLFVLALLASAAALYAGRTAWGVGEAATPAPQDVIRLESRLSRLEQRLSTIELSIRGLEQQSRLSAAAPGGTGARAPEVSLLRSEVEALRRRLADAECGLAKVDERTLTPAAREERRQSAAAPTDPCRLGAETPVRLSARP